MDFEINNYCRKKTFASLMLIYGMLTANAFALAFTQQMGEYMENSYYVALTVLLAYLIAVEVIGIFMFTFQMARNVELKEHQRGLMPLASATNGIMASIFTVNIVVAVLNHYAMMSLKEKL